MHTKDKEKAIQKFLEDNFNNGLRGYFDIINEKAEHSIVENTPSPFPSPPTSTPTSFSIEEDSKGCGKRFSVKIIVNAKGFAGLFDYLPGQLLRNRSRIESNLLTAIRKLSQEQLWDASVIDKVTVVVQ